MFIWRISLEYFKICGISVLSIPLFTWSSVAQTMQSTSQEARSLEQEIKSGGISSTETGKDVQWVHLSTENGDLPKPNTGTQQTASIVMDVDKDGVTDFLITERTRAPAIVWYKRKADGWDRYIVEEGKARMEAGSAYHDIDQDGDLDVVFGGDSSTNEVWWWENPYPDYDPQISWKRRLIKKSGGKQHHDQLFGDFDGDGQAELVFWNQKAYSLYLAEIPENPKLETPWDLTVIYEWTPEEMELRGGEYPPWKAPNMHEGLAATDIDLDGKMDIVGGGRWFKHVKDKTFSAHIIDAAFMFTRSAAGQLVEGGRPEVVLTPADGRAPMMMYEYSEGVWKGKVLVEEVFDGHSLTVLDFNGDGYMDIFNAETRLRDNPDATIRILLGDGKGNFTLQEVNKGYGLHESRIADLDGDGDYDILGKPFKWETPRLDIWLQEGTAPSNARLDQWKRHLIEPELPYRGIYITAADMNGDKLKDIIVGDRWYKNPGKIKGKWKPRPIGSPLNNVATVYDFDGDGDMDLLGTRGIGSKANAEFLWANNDGKGNFTIMDNIAPTEGDFLQGAVVAQFWKGARPQVALSWHKPNVKKVRILSIPDNPVQDTWTWQTISSSSQNEDLSAGDIDGDGDLDLLLGTRWLENPGNRPSDSDDKEWQVHELGRVTKGEPDRNDLFDFNGDGKLDALVGLENGEDILLFTSPADAKEPWKRSIVASDVGGGFSMDAADVDKDGDMDMVLGEHRGKPFNRVILYENIKGGVLWRPIIIDKGEGEKIDHHDGTQFFDLDNDGDLDIISVGWYNPKVWVYENKSK